MSLLASSARTAEPFAGPGRLCQILAGPSAGVPTLWEVIPALAGVRRWQRACSGPASKSTPSPVFSQLTLVADAPELPAQADPATASAITPITASLASHLSTKPEPLPLAFVVSISTTAMIAKGLSATRPPAAVML